MKPTNQNAGFYSAKVYSSAIVEKISNAFKVRLSLPIQHPVIGLRILLLKFFFPLTGVR